MTKYLYLPTHWKCKLTPSFSLLWLLNFKDKDKILKASRQKDNVTYKGKEIGLVSDILKQYIKQGKNEAPLKNTQQNNLWIKVWKATKLPLRKVKEENI